MITACQKINAYRFVCYRSIDIVFDLINDLRLFIITFKKTHKSKIYFIDQRQHIKYFEKRFRSSYLFESRSGFLILYDRKKILKYDSKDSFDKNMKTLMIETSPISEKKSMIKWDEGAQKKKPYKGSEELLQKSKHKWYENIREKTEKKRKNGYLIDQKRRIIWK